MKKIKIKRLWLRLWGPAEVYKPLLGSPVPPQVYNLHLIDPLCMNWLNNITFLISEYSNVEKTKTGPSKVLFLLFKSHVN